MVTPIELLVLIVLGAIGGLLHWVIPVAGEDRDYAKLAKRAIAGAVIAPIVSGLFMPVLAALLKTSDPILGGYFGTVLAGYFGLDILIVILDYAKPHLLTKPEAAEEDPPESSTDAAKTMSDTIAAKEDEGRSIKDAKWRH